MRTLATLITLSMSLALVAAIGAADAQPRDRPEFGGAADIAAPPDPPPPPPPADASCPVKPLADPACGPEGCVVDFTVSAGPTLNADDERQRFKKAAEQPNTLVRLHNDIDLDFTGLPYDFFPVYIGRCTTVTSIADAPSARPPPPSPPILYRAVPGGAASGASPMLLARIIPDVTAPQGSIGEREAYDEPAPSQARTPHSLGPTLHFGKTHASVRDVDKPQTFLEAHCWNDPMGAKNDGVAISGFGLFGPTPGQQETGEVGIMIVNCVDISISNMEISGWGGAGVKIEDDELVVPEGCVLFPSAFGGWHCPPGVEVTRTKGRILAPNQVQIVGNYMHHNQHPSVDGAAGGYGVDVGAGAWALILANVFDDNRHAIAGNGASGGYTAIRNLVLKGGGFHDHYPVYGSVYTHQFDVHGDDNCDWISFFSSSLWNCGNAGDTFVYRENAFQYTRDNAIKLRGKPRTKATIAKNVFAHGLLMWPFGGDAISLRTGDNVEVFDDNLTGVDPYGRYGVCDFDGDGVDDFFLATGRTWWFSSYGAFQWSFLSAQPEQLADVRLGYFDDDRQCDVMVERGGQWLFARAGFDAWVTLGAFGVPLKDVVVGRFDPNEPDHRTNVNLKTTHALHRRDDGQWLVTPLSAPNWIEVASSGRPLVELKFGDFTGDGVTDVLSVDGGKWSISESARGSWRPINTLGDAMTPLVVANLDADDNIDDLLRLDTTAAPFRLTCKWMRSKNGVDAWRTYYQRTMDLFGGAAPPGCYGLAGKFGAAPGGGVMIIDRDRVGRFFSEAEKTGQNPSGEFPGRFPY